MEDGFFSDTAELLCFLDCLHHVNLSQKRPKTNKKPGMIEKLPPDAGIGVRIPGGVLAMTLLAVQGNFRVDQPGRSAGIYRDGPVVAESGAKERFRFRFLQRG
jgi:hypothetical protein